MLSKAALGGVLSRLTQGGGECHTLRMRLPSTSLHDMELLRGSSKPAMKRDMIPKVSQWHPKLGQTQRCCLGLYVLASGSLKQGFVSCIPGSQVF